MHSEIKRKKWNIVFFFKKSKCGTYIFFFSMSSVTIQKPSCRFIVANSKCGTSFVFLQLATYCMLDVENSCLIDKQSTSTYIHNKAGQQERYDRKSGRRAILFGLITHYSVRHRLWNIPIETSLRSKTHVLMKYIL